jgi:hypothetical protein
MKNVPDLTKIDRRWVLLRNRTSQTALWTCLKGSSSSILLSSSPNQLDVISVCGPLSACAGEKLAERADATEWIFDRHTNIHTYEHTDTFLNHGRHRR